MKKTTLILAGLALLAASCTKTEVVSNGAQDNGKGIGFSAYTAKHTKAAEVTNETLNSFDVTAIGNEAVYFDKVTYTKNALTDFWESNPLHFWPAYSLDFYAYNKPAKGTFNTSINTSGQILTYTPSTNLDEQEDLVAAKAMNQTQPETGATSLTFSHYLTQVIVKAKSSNDNYKVEVCGVKVANLKNSVKYTFSTQKSEIADGATEQDYTASFTAKILEESAIEVMTDSGERRWYLVPQTVIAWNQESDKKNSGNGVYLALNVKITTAGGAQIYPKTGSNPAWMAVPIPTTWTSNPAEETTIFQQGKKYTLTLDFFKNGGAGFVDPEAPGELDGDAGTEDNGKPIIGGAIKFSATVSGWENVDITISL